MKQLYILLIVLILFQGCRDEKSQKNGEKTNETIEIIQDRTFKNGLLIRGNDSSKPVPIGRLYPIGKGVEEPSWAIAQWGTHHVMNDISPTIINDSIVYKQDAKRLFFYPQRDGNTIIGLEVFASKEYSAPRKLGENWVHLLIEQSFKNLILLKTVQSINYKLKAKLLFCSNKMYEEFNPDLHTAQITFFLTIQNSIKDSPQYGDFFWFGLPLYDYRYSKIAEYGAEDLGKDDASKKFISTVASDELFSGSLHSMDWISIDKNIYPLIKKSFETAQSRGYMKGSKWEDLCITGMNIGWEVPGTFDCGIMVECPSLIATMNN
ncbi:MAG: hypothetical protein VB075_02190 [Petrimonas sp.]|uniref:hypothetical protein n=1 Tax=Petrimonas sp. TaxID=2023866 RepID=UPI002B3AC2A8|nr:hypothetical protein [Petrimonas sp.]